MSKNNPQFLNLKKTLEVVLLCMMTVVVSAQSDKQLPSAILVHTECCDCKHPTYDTLCHFSYEDITLTDTSITFRDMKCIHYYDDKDNPNRVRYLCGTYLFFVFPDGGKYTLELFSWYSSFTPVYAPMWYREEFGNTLPLSKRFLGKDWSKKVSELVKKWNQFAP